MENDDSYVKNKKDETDEKEAEQQTASTVSSPFKFTEEAKKQLEALNDERLKIKKIKRIPTIGFIIIFISFSFLKAITPFYIYIPCILIGVGLIAYYFMKGAKEENKFRTKYKKILNDAIFKNYLDDYEYLPNKGISRDYIYNTNAIQIGNIFYSEDSITGSYKGIYFLRCDLKIQDEHTDSDGDSHTVTLFEGQWMKFDFPKSFKSNIQVYSKGFNNVKKNKKNFFTKKFNKEKNDEKRTLILTESEEFNKKFKIYASNEHDAYYVLTPHLLEAIEKLKSEFSCPVMLLFTNNSLDVALYTKKDSLEPSYKKDMEKAIEESINDATNQMTTLMKFVDYLKLDNNLFK